MESGGCQIRFEPVIIDMMRPPPTDHSHYYRIIYLFNNFGAKYNILVLVYRRYENVVQQGEMLNVCAMMFCTTVSRALKVEYIFYKI